MSDSPQRPPHECPSASNLSRSCCVERDMMKTSLPLNPDHAIDIAVQEPALRTQDKRMNRKKIAAAILLTLPLIASWRQLRLV